MSNSDQMFVFEINKTDDLTNNVSQLNMILNRFANFEIIQLNDRTTLLKIEIDKEIDQKKSRNAGRKVQHPQKLYTYKEVSDMMKEHTKEEVAKKLGYSRATFYRRLKKLATESAVSGQEDHYFF